MANQSFGIVLVFVLVGLVGLMIWRTGGALTRAHWFVLLVSVAMVAGLGFWLWTGSSGSFSVAGLKLGGGAAVGAAFMYLAWKLVGTRGDHGYTVVSLPFPRGDIDLSWSDQIVLAQFLKDGRLFVEFRQGHERGEIRVHQAGGLDGGSMRKDWEKRFTVNVAGGWSENSK